MPKRLTMLRLHIAVLISWLTLMHAEAKPPNIVMVVADDYGFRDIGYHGAEFPTPNLDSLAAAGVKLENYYVQPICSPTRSQLMTGRYQIHTGLQHSIIWPSQPYGLPLQFPTIANHLKDAGYSTHAVGKWHLGLYKKEYTPLHRGFDSFYGYWTGGEDYYTHYLCDFHRNGSMGLNDPMKDVLGQSKNVGAQRWCGNDLRDMETPVKNMSGVYSTHLYTRKAIEKVQETAASGKPLFMYLAYQAVHSPMEAPASYVKPFSHIKNRNRRIYAGMTGAMDEGIGNVTKALKEAGMWDNTVFIFTTDNGGQVLAGGNNWPLRGYKTTLWEGGLRGVAFVSGGGLNRSSVVSEELMHVSDWFPTLANIAGSQSLPGLDGVNQWPMLSQGKGAARSEILHNIDILTPPQGAPRPRAAFDVRIRAAVRVGDFKLITGNPGDDRWFPPPKHAEEVDSYAVPSASSKNVWLFNVREDPSEVFDLSDKYPDTVDSLLTVLAKYNATAVPPIYPSSDPNCDPQKHGGYWGPWE